MRSCIYCGRELEKGEVCNCPASVKRRAQKSGEHGAGASAYSENTKKDTASREDSAQAGTENSGAWGQTDSSHSSHSGSASYHTGYTAKESRIKKAWDRFRAKREAARNSGDFTKGFLNVLKEGIKSPVKAIEGAHDISMAMILLLAALQGAALWLCAYFIVTNVDRGPLTILASVMSFKGAEGYSAVLKGVLAAASGAVSGIILFFLYSGIFFFINRFIFRQKTRYRDFCQRLSLAGIPLIIAGALGILMSHVSRFTLMILLFCGGVGWIVLTYEALKAEWYSKSPDKVAYSMLLGLFVFFMIVCRLVM